MMFTCTYKLSSHQPQTRNTRGCNAEARRLSRSSCSLKATTREGVRLMALSQLYLGLDFGTSGARATVINDAGDVVVDSKRGYGEGAQQDWAHAWESVLFSLISSLPEEVRRGVVSVAFDGTSATTMLLDRNTGALLAPAKLYNESQGKAEVEAAKAMAPPAHTATASTSTLAKVLTWHLAGTWQAAVGRGLAPCILHQADWLASLLHGDRGTSDWNNALKLGFDPGQLSYPDWLVKQDFYPLLPARVLAPGAPAGTVTAAAAARSGLPAGCLVCAGTTDSIAAFIAAGVSQPGQAVSSLGSTLAVKLLSTSRVDDAAFGVYSHRLGDAWLVGGASNTGGAVLRHYFTDEQIRELTPRLQPASPTGLHYYPLLQPGERFPINDPQLQPCLEPRPADDAVFLQGIFEGIARIEADAYSLLHRLGASRVTEVHSAGGGAVNAAWTSIRQAAVGVPVIRAANGEASYGAALLARQGAKQAASRQAA